MDENSKMHMSRLMWLINTSILTRVTIQLARCLTGSIRTALHISGRIPKPEKEIPIVFIPDEMAGNEERIFHNIRKEELKVCGVSSTLIR